MIKLELFLHFILLMDTLPCHALSFLSLSIMKNDFNLPKNDDL